MNMDQDFTDSGYYKPTQAISGKAHERALLELVRQMDYLQAVEQHAELFDELDWMHVMDDYFHPGYYTDEEYRLVEWRAW